jgi:hypothetical protein
VSDETKLVEAGVGIWVRPFSLSLGRTVVPVFVLLFIFIIILFDDLVLISSNIHLIFCCCSPYFRPRSNALEGLIVVSFVGVCSGYYIFKPLFEGIAANQAERKRREAIEATTKVSFELNGNGNHHVVKDTSAKS